MFCFQFLIGVRAQGGRVEYKLRTNAVRVFYVENPQQGIE